MEKQDIDERAVDVAKARLEREIEIRSKSDEFMEGYREAILDFLWDYVGKTQISDAWEKCVNWARNINSALDTIKLNS